MSSDSATYRVCYKTITSMFNYMYYIISVDMVLDIPYKIYVTNRSGHTASLGMYEIERLLVELERTSLYLKTKLR